MDPLSSTLHSINDYYEEDDIDNENVNYFHSFNEDETRNFVSPINLNITRTERLTLPNLLFIKHESVPKKLKITNTGFTINITAKWPGERPSLIKGPLRAKYIFSTLHFHWGANVMEGSEHTADRIIYPLEMHVSYYKSTYGSHDTALRFPDGIAILVYFFQLQGGDNPELQIILDVFGEIRKAGSFKKFEKPIALSFIVKEFKEDYLLYWGNVVTSLHSHVVMWIVSRQLYGVSVEQLEIFRTLLDSEGNQLLRNFRETKPINAETKLFFVNPSMRQNATLLMLHKEASGFPNTE